MSSVVLIDRNVAVAVGRLKQATGVVDEQSYDGPDYRGIDDTMHSQT